jgi:hypothetical protein
MREPWTQSGYEVVLGNGLPVWALVALLPLDGAGAVARTGAELAG